MRPSKSLWYLACAGAVLGLAALAAPASAQSIEFGPGGIRVTPQAPQVIEVERDAPPPQRFEERRTEPRRGSVDSRWEAVREQMAEFREGCEDGNRRACVRLGIIIGENRERRQEWSREHPEMFSWDRDRR